MLRRCLRTMRLRVRRRRLRDRDCCGSDGEESGRRRYGLLCCGPDGRRVDLVFRARSANAGLRMRGGQRMPTNSSIAPLDGTLASPAPRPNERLDRPLTRLEYGLGAPNGGCRAPQSGGRSEGDCRESRAYEGVRLMSSAPCNPRSVGAGSVYIFVCVSSCVGHCCVVG